MVTAMGVVGAMVLVMVGEMVILVITDISMGMVSAKKIVQAKDERF